MTDNPNPNPNGPAVTPVTETKPTVATTPAPVVSEEETFSKKYVEELRQEAAKHRTEKQAEKARVDALEAELKKFQDAQLSEEDRRKQELDELRSSNSSLSQVAKEASLNFKIALEAPSRQVKDVDAAVKLIDRKLLQFDDTGNLSGGMDEAMDALKEKHSWLFGASTPTAPNPGTTNPGKAPKAAQLTRADLAKMDPIKVNELWKSGDLKHLF